MKDSRISLGLLLAALAGGGIVLSPSVGPGGRRAEVCTASCIVPADGIEHAAPFDLAGLQGGPASSLAVAAVRTSGLVEDYYPYDYVTESDDSSVSEDVVTETERDAVDSPVNEQPWMSNESDEDDPQYSHWPDEEEQIDAEQVDAGANEEWSDAEIGYPWSEYDESEWDGPEYERSGYDEDEATGSTEMGFDLDEDAEADTASEFDSSDEMRDDAWEIERDYGNWEDVGDAERGAFEAEMTDEGLDEVRWMESDQGGLEGQEYNEEGSAEEDWPETDREPWLEDSGHEDEAVDEEMEWRGTPINEEYTADVNSLYETEAEYFRDWEEQPEEVTEGGSEPENRDVEYGAYEDEWDEDHSVDWQEAFLEPVLEPVGSSVRLGRPRWPGRFSDRSLDEPDLEESAAEGQCEMWQPSVESDEGYPHETSWGDEVYWRWAQRAEAYGRYESDAGNAGIDESAWDNGDESGVEAGGAAREVSLARRTPQWLTAVRAERLIVTDRQLLEELERLSDASPWVRRLALDDYLVSLGSEVLGFVAHFENVAGEDVLDCSQHVPAATAFLASYRLYEQGLVGMDDAVQLVQQIRKELPQGWVEGARQFTWQASARGVAEPMTAAGPPTAARWEARNLVRLAVVWLNGSLGTWIEALGGRSLWEMPGLAWQALRSSQAQAQNTASYLLRWSGRRQ